MNVCVPLVRGPGSPHMDWVSQVSRGMPCWQLGCPWEELGWPGTPEHRAAAWPGWGKGAGNSFPQVLKGVGRLSRSLASATGTPV